MVQINCDIQWRSGCLAKRRILDLFLQILNEAERETALGEKLCLQLFEDKLARSFCCLVKRI